MNEMHPKPIIIQYDRASFRLLKAYLLESICQVEDFNTSLHKNVTNFDYMDKELEISEPGCQGLLFQESKKQLYQTFGGEMILYLCYEKTLFNDSKLYLNSDNKDELDNKWIENMFSFIFNYGRPLNI
jgi:hypothetical protein